MTGDSVTADEAVATRAWSWIGDRLSAFTAFTNGDFTIPAAQRLPELAVAVLSYGRSELPGNPVLELAVGHLDSARRERAFADRAIRSPQEYSLHLDTYALLRQLGREDPAQRHALETGLRAGLARMSERPPHRLMDVALSLHWAGLAGGMPSIEACMDTTLMAAMPDAVHLHEAALYAFTHVIFFAAAFGVEPPLIPIAPIRPLERQLTVLLWRLESERHYDLLAEVLLCWDLVGYEHTPPYRRALRVLLEQQDEAGGFPGPAAALPDGRRPSPDEDQYFAHHYHTTLLVLLLLAQRNRRRWPHSAAPREIPVHAPGDAVRPLRHVLASSARAADDRARELDRTASADEIAAALSWRVASGGDPAPILRGAGALLDRLGAGTLTYRTLEAMCDLHGVDPSPGLRLRLTELARIVGGSDDESPGLTASRAALRRAGFLAAARSVDVHSVTARAEAEYVDLRRSAPGLAALLEAVPGGDVPWLADVVDAAASHAYREGDLGAAARLWGVVAAASEEAFVRERIVSLLAATQRADGTFGYFGPEEQKLRSYEAAPPHPWRWVQADVARTLGQIASARPSPDDAREAAGSGRARMPPRSRQASPGPGRPGAITDAGMEPAPGPVRA